MNVLKPFAARLPDRWQMELKRLHFARQIRRGSFKTSEPEYNMLPRLIGPGNWVLDIGANVGHYTKRMSELVGPGGRVIAFEPVPATFALLAANVQRFEHANVTLINAAASGGMGTAGMTVPKFPTGLTNYYEARLSNEPGNNLDVLTLPVDALCINRPIALVKIDAEGHEAFVLEGMKRLLADCHPVLIVETDSREVAATLAELGYAPEKLENSPNILFRLKQ